MIGVVFLLYVRYVALRRDWQQRVVVVSGDLTARWLRAATGLLLISLGVAVLLPIATPQAIRFVEAGWSSAAGLIALLAHPHLQFPFHVGSGAAGHPAPEHGPGPLGRPRSPLRPPTRAIHAVPTRFDWAAVAAGLAVPACLLIIVMTCWPLARAWSLVLLTRPERSWVHVPTVSFATSPVRVRRQLLVCALPVAVASLLLFAVHAVGVMFLAGGLLWSVVLASFAYRVRLARRPLVDRPGLGDHLAAFIAALRLLWSALRRTPRDDLAASVAIVEETGAQGPPKRGRRRQPRWSSLALSPREQVFRSYRTLVKRAARRGLTLGPSTTALELNAALRPLLRFAHDDLARLTSQYNLARYSCRESTPEHAHQSRLALRQVGLALLLRRAGGRGLSAHHRGEGAS